MEKIKPSELSLTFATELFFDTNIWVFLFGSLGNYESAKQKEYSKLFESVLSKKSTIYLTSMILSEYANVVLRYEFKNWQKREKNFNAIYKKDFVGTQIYKEKVEQVKQQLNSILKLPNIVKLPDSFNSISLENIFSDFGAADFNDSYINEIVSSRNLVIVTDDGDFKDIFNGKTLVSMS
jgi:predicted nucleic acid-binding protein